MHIKEGLIPTVLGTAVTTAAAAAASTKYKSKSKDMAPMIAAGVVGFGLAHIVLGAIDLIEHR